MSEKLRDVTLKLTAVADVHIRQHSPELKGDDNKKGVIHEGFTVDFVEEWRGDTYPGTDNNIWYKDKNGDFLWSGGFGDEVTTGQTKEFNDTLIPKEKNYNESFLQVPLELRKTKGAGIRIAVIDSGVQTTHEVFKGEIQESFNAENGGKKVIDTRNHGTHITGLIGARNFALKKSLIGIAPESELYICKVSSTKKVFTEHLETALDWAIKKRCNVINMSFELNDVELDSNEAQTNLLSLLETAKAKNIAMVASAGNNGFLTEKYDTKAYYPASYEQCIAVGSISKTHLPDIKNEISKRVQFLMPFEKIYSSINENGKFDSFHGSSMSTALVSGVIALIKSNYPDTSLDEQVDILYDIAQPISNSHYTENPLFLYFNDKFF